jgi:hypothetical protein
MSTSDLVKEVFNALDDGDYDIVSANLDRDFKFSGPTPNPIGKQEFIAFERALRRAMPDLKHNCSVLWEGKESEARGEVRVTGTHQNVLDLSYVPKVEATSKRVKLPTERWTARVKNGRIVSFAAEVGPDGGLLGILKQIGREDLADCLRTKGGDCRIYEESKSMGLHTF